MANRKTIGAKSIGQTTAELLRGKKLDQLKSLSGKIHLDVDWKTLEQTEIRHQASVKPNRHHHR